MEPELLAFCIPDRIGVAVIPVEVKLESNGRVLLPADVRRKLDIKPGDTLMLDVGDDGIHLWTRAMAARDLQTAVSRAVTDGVSLVSELRGLRQVEEASLASRGSQTRKPRSRGKR